ncbi:hypothetical protein C2S52_005558 [Perilla frutescens var. hirtella]|nr:hypothetical protein C2S52_005558 [Perilla frutescens var. hirtella]
MSWQRIVVQHSGRWERSEYVDGEDQLVHLPFDNLSRDKLVEEIHDFMETSPTSHGGPHNFSSEDVGPDVEAPKVEFPPLRQWSILMAHVDDALAVVEDDPCSTDTDALAVRKTFLEKKDLIIAMGKWHMQRQVEYSMSRLSKSRLTVIYKQNETCPFKLVASAKSGLWIVTKLEDSHACRLDMTRNALRKLSSQVIADFFKKRILDEGSILRPRAMVIELLREYDIESFAVLPAYLEMLKKCNPDMVYYLETDGDDRFMYTFVVLGVCRAAFRLCMRPIIAIDGTYLNGKTKERFKRDFGDRDDLVIVSDQHVSIKNAVKAVYPTAVHGLCYYHIAKNLARAGVHHWARSQCRARRYSFMTSNAAECFNARLLWARRLLICSLIEVVRDVIEKWFDERRAKTVSRDHILTEDAYKKLYKQVEMSMVYVVRGHNANLYKVQNNDKSFLINLQMKTCECGKFQLDQIPCSHAATAIRVGHDMYDYVDLHYKQVTLCLAYHDHVCSVPHKEEWTVSSSFKLCSPKSVLQAGRPKEGRYHSAVEGSSRRSRRQQLCSRCGDTGHNKKKCTAPQQIELEEWGVPGEGDEIQIQHGNKEEDDPELQFKCTMMRLRAKKLQAYLQASIRHKFEMHEDEGAFKYLGELLSGEVRRARSSYQHGFADPSRSFYNQHRHLYHQNRCHPPPLSPSPP